METVNDVRINYIDFEKMNLKELISYCKEHKITRYSNKNKGELISYIKDIPVDTNANTEDLITREYLEKEKICLVC